MAREKESGGMDDVEGGVPPEELFRNLLEFMDDTTHDSMGYESSDWMEGFRYSRHLVEQFYISKFRECECSHAGFLEKLKSGEWHCPDCGTTTEGVPNRHLSTEQ